jgi:hypothetical protein
MILFVFVIFSSLVFSPTAISFESKNLKLVHEVSNSHFKFNGESPLEVTSRSKRKLRDDGSVIIIPPIALFLLSTSSCQASQLNAKVISTSGPFFQGLHFNAIPSSLI